MWYDDRRLGQPGEGKATYLYAHARTGMFLPLLNQSKIQNGKKMIGMVVELWTNDDQRFLYVITDVRRHVPTTSAFNAPFAADDRAALAPDVGRRRADAQAPGRRRAAVAGAGRPRRGQPGGQAGQLQLGQLGIVPTIA